MSILDRSLSYEVFHVTERNEVEYVIELQQHL